jgi:hypothetical protein
MRTKDIRVGNVYYVNVGGRRVEVRVLRDRGGRGRRYQVERTDNGQVLPSLRAGSAIHKDKVGYWPGIMEPRKHLEGTVNGEYEQPSEEELREDAVVISDQRGRGYTVMVGREAVARVADWDEAVRAANAWMKRNQYWPNLYYINERGNIDLLDQNGNILASWV